MGLGSSLAAYEKRKMKKAAKAAFFVERATYSARRQVVPPLPSSNTTPMAVS